MRSWVIYNRWYTTHGFYSKIIENMTVRRLAAKITPKNSHLITLSDEKSGTMLFKALKTGFVENEGRSGPLSVDSKTRGKCQLSVNPIQTLLHRDLHGILRQPQAIRQQDWLSTCSIMKLTKPPTAQCHATMIYWLVALWILGFHITSPKFKLRNYRFF